MIPVLAKSLSKQRRINRRSSLDQNLGDVNFVSRRPKMTKFSGALRAPTSKCVSYRFPFSKERFLKFVSKIAKFSGRASAPDFFWISADLQSSHPQDPAPNIRGVTREGGVTYFESS